MEVHLNHPFYLWKPMDVSGKNSPNWPRHTARSTSYFAKSTNSYFLGLRDHIGQLEFNLFAGITSHQSVFTQLLSAKSIITANALFIQVLMISIRIPQTLPKKPVIHYSLPSFSNSKLVQTGCLG